MKSTFLRILGIAAICLLLTAAFSCKSKKKVADTSDADKARQEQMEAEREQREAEALREQEEKERLAREEAAKNEPYNKLGQYFNAVANASSETAADKSINEALNMFASGDVPVLIIIYENEAEQTVDYDEPTTIKDYLHYLKVVKRKPDSVESLKFDDTGKISEVILRK